MNKVDLTKDIRLLEYHQADELLDQLVLIELHFLRIYEGKFVGLCINCLDKKHFRAVRGLTSECLSAKCQPQPLWEEINTWANDILENKINEKYLGKDNPNTKQLYEEARYYRKQVEKILDKIKNGIKNKGYTGIHLTK